MESFIFKKSYSEAIDDEENGLTDVERLNLYRAIMRYVFEGETPRLKGVSKIIFGLIKGQIECELTKRAQDKENGKRGGRPRKTPLSEEKTPLSEEKTPVFTEETQEKGGFLKNEQKEVPQTEKERSKEKEYNPQEKTIPPYNPPKAGTDGDETDETIKGYLEFMREHPYITEDLNNPSELYGIDFPLLAHKIAQSSRYLQGKQSLKWLIGHYREIIGDSYKDFSRNGEPPDIPTGKGDLQLWREVVNALNWAKEERLCDNAERGMERFRMADEEAKREMGELYKGLSPEITAYFEPNSFLDLCKMDEGELKFERARFLKALGGIRQKLAKEKANG